MRRLRMRIEEITFGYIHIFAEAYLDKMCI